MYFEHSDDNKDAWKETFYLVYLCIIRRIEFNYFQQSVIKFYIWIKQVLGIQLSLRTLLLYILLHLYCNNISTIDFVSLVVNWSHVHKFMRNSRTFKHTNWNLFYFSIVRIFFKLDEISILESLFAAKTRDRVEQTSWRTIN